MRKLILLISAITMVGCSTIPKQTPPDRIAFNTIGTVEQTASAAVDGYFTAVVHGIASTNDVPKVAFAWNQLRSDCLLAAMLVENGTNAVAPVNLTAELQQLSLTIQTATKH